MECNAFKVLQLNVFQVVLFCLNDNKLFHNLYGNKKKKTDVSVRIVNRDTNQKKKNML